MSKLWASYAAIPLAVGIRAKLTSETNIRRSGSRTCGTYGTLTKMHWGEMYLTLMFGRMNSPSWSGRTGCNPVASHLFAQSFPIDAKIISGPIDLAAESF